VIENQGTIIYDIMQKYPEKEWLYRCREALPGDSDGAILSAIEIFCGGDVRVVEEDGTERGYFND